MKTLVSVNLIATTIILLLLSGAASDKTSGVLEVPNPLVEQRADPSIYLHSDGYYYFTASHPAYDRIILRRSKTLAGLATADEVVIWHKHPTGIMGAHIWAPELHFIDGTWYIYFAAGAAEEVWAIRMYVLENTSANPFEGEWNERGQIQSDFESFSLDATVFSHLGNQYMVWAQYDGPNSNLYIARMSNPWTLSSPQVMISTPEYSWETVGYRVNEGPAVLKRNGKVFITYSASATDANYAMGLLYVDENANLLDSSAWVKSPTPVFRSGNGVFGPGHNQFTTTKSGREDILVYHGRPYQAIDGNSLYDPNRHTRVQQLRWDETGMPIFGNPEPAGLVTIAPQSNRKNKGKNRRRLSKLVAQFNFDEAQGPTTENIASCPRQRAILRGGATWSSGPNGSGALAFDGNDGYLHLPNNLTQGIDDFTVSTWVYLNSAARWSRIFDFGTGTAINMFLSPNAGNDKLMFAINDGNSITELSGPEVLTTGQWTHVAVSKSANVGTLYVNGEAVSSVDTMTQKPGDMHNTAQNYLGKSQHPDPYLDGQIDDFRLYKQALSQQQIQQIYQRDTEAELNQAAARPRRCRADQLPRDGLVAHYKLDERRGVIAKDISGNGHHGRYIGEPELRGNGGVWLDGHNDYVQLPSNLIANLDSITVSLDVRLDSSQAGPYFLFGLGNPASASGGDGYLFATGDRMRAGLTTGNWSGEQMAASQAYLPRDIWHTLTYTLDGESGTARLYLDSVEVASQTEVSIKPADIGLGSTIANAIGRSNYQSDKFLSAGVRNFRIYSRALKISEIEALLPEPQELSQALAASIDIANSEDIRGNIHLPAKLDGYEILWQSSQPNIISPSGIVTRPEQDTQVVLEALITLPSVDGPVQAHRSFTLTVRAAIPATPFEGYAFAYFTANTLEGEKIYFAASDGNNALAWDELNAGQPLIASQHGSGGLRDPFIIRSPEGDTFYMIATDLSIGSGTSWDDAQRRGSLFIEVWESHDLVNWSQQRHVRVSPNNAGNTWAPEAYYDESLGAYVVFWASKLYAESDPDKTANTYNRMLYATTRDFVHFSPAQIWQGGISRIDSTVIKDGELYHRFTKDEGAGTTGCSDIIHETSPELRASLPEWQWVSGCIGRDVGTSAVEGPSVFRSNPGDLNGDFVYLFVDEYGGRGYVPLRTADLDQPQWHIPADYNLPGAPRHGTVLPVTAEELAGLRELIVSIPEAPANAQGEILRYDFEGSAGATLLDISGNQLHGSIQGGATTSEGELILDGVDDYILMPENLMSGVSNISVEAQVYIDPAQANPYFIYGLGNSLGSNGDGYLFTTGNPYRSSLSLSNWSGEQNVNTGSDLTRGEWLHLMYTLEGGTATLYLNGEALASAEVSIKPGDIAHGASTANYLGRSLYANDAYFQGRFAEFALYNRALSAEEVQQRFVDSTR